MKTKVQSIFKSLADLPSETANAVKYALASAAEFTQRVFGSQTRTARIISSDSYDSSRMYDRQSNDRWRAKDEDFRYRQRSGSNE